MFPTCKSSGFKPVSFESKALLLSHLIPTDIGKASGLWRFGRWCVCGMAVVHVGVGEMMKVVEIWVRVKKRCMWDGVAMCASVWYVCGVGGVSEMVWSCVHGGGWDEKEGDGCVCMVHVGMGKWLMEEGKNGSLIDDLTHGFYVCFGRRNEKKNPLWCDVWQIL